MIESSENAYEKRLAETKGSAYQILKFVHDNKIINNTMRYGSSIKCTSAIAEINWISPIKESKFIELADDRFYNKIKDIFEDFNIEKMHEFWPNKGPHWDAVGTYTDDNNIQKLLLVEAKSHIAESQSSFSASNPESIRLIYKSLKQCFNKFAESSSDAFDKYFPIWLCKYYQVANRIAFYEKLTSLGIETTLLFVFFTNAPTHTNEGLKFFTTEDMVHYHYNNLIEEMGLEKKVNDMDIRYTHVEGVKR